MNTTMRTDIEARMDRVESMLREMRESIHHYGRQHRYMEAGICASTKEHLEGEEAFLRRLMERYCPVEAEAPTPEHAPDATEADKLAADAFEQVMRYEQGLELAHDAARKLLRLDIDMDDEARAALSHTYSRSLPDQTPLRLDPRIRPAIESADRILSRLIPAETP